jgi:hypothetical protein
MFKWSASITMAGLALGGLLLTGTPAAAQGGYGPGGYGPGIDQREAYQQQRIERGVGSGALTPGETRYLEREQSRIQGAEQRMMSDGRLSPWERQRLRQMQDRASRDIYRMENNNRTAAGWGGNNHQGWGRHLQTPRPGIHYGPGGGNGTYGRGGTIPPSGHTIQGNTQNPQSWRGNGTYGRGGTGTSASGTTTGGTTTAGNAQGRQGTSYRNGPSGAYQQPGTRPQGQQQYQQARPQGQQQYQQARPQMSQPAVRPNANMMPRQPSGMAGMASRASYSAPRRR